MPAIDHDDALMTIDWNAGISAEENDRRVQELLSGVDGSLATTTTMVGAQEFMLSHTRDITGSEAVVYMKANDPDALELEEPSSFSADLPAFFSESALPLRTVSPGRVK